jgi:hypothetical protein
MIKQTALFDYFDMKPVKKSYGRTQHGGTLGKNHRKEFRPLSTKRWIHLILKSDKAYGSMSLLHPSHKIWIKGLLHRKSKKFGIKISDYANVGNHLHLKIKISSRENFAKFLKSVSALIARKVTGAKRGKPFGKFWQGLAFTRILTSALEELQLKGYIEANRREAQVSKQAREDFLAQFNRWVYRQRRRSKLVESTA